MAKTIIDVGTNANDGTGDPLRTAMQSTNSNFNEVYTLFGNGSTLALSGDVSVSGGTATIGSGAVTGTKVANDTIALTNLADIKINDTTDVIYTSIVVTVVNPGSGNKYYYDGANQVITLSKGQTYRFDQSAGTNSGHPLRFSTTANGTHASGSAYTTNVTVVGTPGNAGAYTQITTEQDTPTLYTYCTAHSGMGNTVSYGGVADGAVTTAKLAADSVTYEKVDDEFTTVNALSAGSTVVVNFDDAQVFTLTPNASTTFNVTNPKIGITKTLIVTGAGGSYTADTWQVGGGSGTFNKIAGTYDDTGSKKNLYQITCVSATEFWYSISQIAS
tara:strand:- start:1360 stop:2352 length:993 start_codon:yes stop_codon:yes gene_type:complete